VAGYGAMATHPIYLLSDSREIMQRTEFGDLLFVKMHKYSLCW